MVNEGRICLVRCPSPFLIDEKVFPPLGLMAVATKLKLSGHDVTVYDGDTIPSGYDVYGFGPTTPEYGYALEMKKILREKEPCARVVLGGPHASEDLWVDGWDKIYVGSYCDENLIIDRSLVDIRSYKYFIDDKLATTVVTAVGCPYKCAFCSKTNGGVKFKSVECVTEEIALLSHEFGYEALMFFDDTFILNYDRVVEICKCLKRFGITWRCFVRGDLVVKHGDKLLKIMKDSGCVEVGMGIESGSNTILKNINKGETVGDIKTAVKMIKRNGIRVKGFIIIGLPGESWFTLLDTMEFLSVAELDDVDFTIFRPYPGSHIWNNPSEYDIKWDASDASKMFYKGKHGEYHNIVSTSILSGDAIVNVRNNMEMLYKS